MAKRKKIINGVDYTNYDFLYKEYVQNYRSLLVPDFRAAEKFIDYLQIIKHVPVGTLKQRLSKDLSGQEVVHICEPMYIPEGGFKKLWKLKKA